LAVREEKRRGLREEKRRGGYAPPRLIGAEQIAVQGDPDEARICTSHVERSNWTLRGHLRRMTRLSNGVSRKRANLRAALAVYFAYYNLCRMYGSIRMTPAMAAGVTGEAVNPGGPAEGGPGDRGYRAGRGSYPLMPHYPARLDTRLTRSVVQCAP
jgi:hypothetical protein